MSPPLHDKAPQQQTPQVAGCCQGGCIKGCPASGQFTQPATEPPVAPYQQPEGPIEAVGIGLLLQKGCYREGERPKKRIVERG